MSAILESKPKNAGDIFAIVDVISLLYQKFPSFYNIICDEMSNLIELPPSYPGTTSIEQKERDETTRIQKQKWMLRLLCELFLCGILKKKCKDLLVPALLHTMVRLPPYLIP